MTPTGVAVPVGRSAATLAIAAVLAATGRVVPAVAVGVVAVTLAQLDVLRPSATRPFHRFVAGAGHVVGVVITFVATVVAELVLVVPAAVLVRVSGDDPLRRSAAGRSRWHGAPSGGRAGRPFGTDRLRSVPQRDERWVPGFRRTAVALGICAVVVALVVRAVTPGTATSETAGGIDVMNTAALLDQPHAIETARETGEAWLGFRYRAYIEVTLDDYRGRYVNITDGVRRSWTPEPTPGDEPLDVLFLGGSTTFGAGLSDDHTIPSEFAKAAADADVPVRVSNYGVPGYTNYQEVLLLARLLASGARPDAVVLYDGFNDTNLALAKWYVDGTPLGLPSHMFADDFTSLLDDKRSDGWGAVGLSTPTARSGERLAPDPDDLLANVADTYEQGMSLARSLASTYGFELLPFWQPTVFDKPLHPGEREMLDQRGFDPFLYDTWASISTSVRDDLPAGTVDLADSLDDEPTAVFFDTVHANEVAAGVVGRAIAASALPTLGAIDPT